MKVELANDIIARKVYEAASIDDKARAMAQRFVEDRYTHFCRSKSILLSRQEMAFIQPYLEQLPLNERQEQFIERSRQHLSRERRQKRYRDAGIVALFCMVVFSSWGMWERQRHAQTHEELATTQYSLATAQDSIHRLLHTARTAQPVSVRENWQPEPTSPIAQFHTLTVQGRITNTKGKPVRQATVEVMGATVKSDNRGRYQVHLVLPPQYWSHTPQLRVQKEFYQEAAHNLDLDKDQIEWNPILRESN